MKKNGRFRTLLTMPAITLGVTISSALASPLSVNLLIGDTTANKVVNATDIAQTKAQSGLPLTSANFRTDVNVSGTITESDISQVKATAGNTAP